MYGSLQYGEFLNDYDAASYKDKYVNMKTYCLAKSKLPLIFLTHRVENKQEILQCPDCEEFRQTSVSIRSDCF